MSENKKPSLKNLGKKEKAIVAGLAALACCIPLGAVALNSQPDTSNENSEKNTSNIVLGTKTKESVKVHFNNDSEKAIKSIRLKKSNEKSWSDNLLKSSEKIKKSSGFDLYTEPYKKSFDIELKFMDGSVSVFEKVGASVEGSISIATRNDKIFLQYVEKDSNEWIELSDSKKLSSDKNDKKSLDKNNKKFSDKDKKDSNKKESNKKDSKNEEKSSSKTTKKADSKNKSGNSKDASKDTDKSGSTSESTSKPSGSSKPSKNESPSENKPSDDKKPTGSTGSSSSKNDKPCTPKYEYVTIPAVTHKEPIVIKEAWTETVYGTKFRCGGCRQLFNTADELTAHQQFYTDQDDWSHTGSSTVTTTTKVEHPAEYGEKEVTDIPEHKEKRQIGCE